jgi:hypothetical protein
MAPRQRIIKLVNSNKPIADRPLTDTDKRLYERMMAGALGVLKVAQEAAQQTQQVVAEHMLAQAELSAEDGWRLNVDRMRWEKYAVTTE